jgi:energy-dependent translational throttle protein EttA
LLSALEAGLEQFAGCAIVISHDRWFLDRVATHIFAFEGDPKVNFSDGNFSDYEEWRKKQLADAALRPHQITYCTPTRLGA